MRVRHVSTTEELQALQPMWNEVVGSCPFHSWQWLHSWWQTLAGQRELFVLVCEDDHRELYGILPLCCERTITGGRVLVFLGTGKACTEYMTVLASAGYEESVAEAFAEWLVENQAAWDQLHLDGTNSTDAKIGVLLSELETKGIEACAIDGAPCWRIELPTTHEEYIDRLSKRHRRKLRNAFRQVIESENYSTTRVTDASELQGVFDDFVDLHVRRRLTLDGDHCFRIAEFYDFLILAADRMHSAGMLDLTRSLVNDTVAGVQFGFKDDATFYLYQSGMNPDLSRFSPGWAMNCAKILSCIDNGMQSYDLLRGNESYKRHLGARPVATVQYRVAAPRVMSRIRHQLWKTKQTVRSWRDTLASSDRW